MYCLSEAPAVFSETFFLFYPFSFYFVSSSTLEFSSVAWFALAWASWSCGTEEVCVCVPSILREFCVVFGMGGGGNAKSMLNGR
jgi:hypothetical protein